MSKQVEPGFLLEPVKVPLAKILPTRKLQESVKVTTRYKVIAASIAEVGIIEPPIVFPEKGVKGTYVLLDGHVRVEVLRDLGETDVECLISRDDENCTYNHKVNRLAPIQEIKMIRKAIAAGVPEERIAKALNLTPRTVRESQSRLHGITAEAIEILKDKPIADMALRVFKKVKPYRQVEMAELMVAAGRYSTPYANALLLNTARDQLVDGNARAAEPRPEDMAKMEHEMQALERDFLLLNESYGRDVMELTLARAYVKKLLDNARVLRFLSQKKPDLLREFQQIVEATSLEG